MKLECDALSVLRKAFVAAEIEVLQQDEAFTRALQTASTAPEMAVLIEAAETLLTEKCRANPIARQFRREARKDREATGIFNAR